MLDRHVATGNPATLFVTLNIPGVVKDPPGAGKLFAWSLDKLAALHPGQEILEHGRDLLGCYAIIGIQEPAVDVKHGCITLETSLPAARLLDLDVYDDQGRQIDRARLSLPARTCLICNQPAVDCIRLQRHSVMELSDTIHELLAPYRD